jgi:hypothetical protein
MARLHAASELTSVPCAATRQAVDGSVVVDVVLAADSAVVLVFCRVFMTHQYIRYTDPHNPILAMVWIA